MAGGREGSQGLRRQARPATKLRRIDGRGALVLRDTKEASTLHGGLVCDDSGCRDGCGAPCTDRGLAVGGQRGYELVHEVGVRPAVPGVYRLLWT